MRESSGVSDLIQQLHTRRLATAPGDDALFQPPPSERRGRPRRAVTWTVPERVAEPQRERVRRAASERRWPLVLAALAAGVGGIYLAARFSPLGDTASEPAVQAVAASAQTPVAPPIATLPAPAIATAPAAPEPTAAAEPAPAAASPAEPAKPPPDAAKRSRSTHAPRHANHATAAKKVAKHAEPAPAKTAPAPPAPTPPSAQAADRENPL